MDATSISRHRRAWGAAHIAGWLAGALLLSAPFNLFFKLGNGNLGHNMLITFACALLGIAVVVPVVIVLARRAKPLGAPRSERLGLAVTGANLLFAGAAVGALAHWWPARATWISSGIWGVLAVVTFACGEGRASERKRRSWRRWMRRRWSFNGAYWIGIFVLLAGGDLFALSLIEGLNAFERISAGLQRLMTQAVVTIALMLLFHGIRGLTPKCFRPVVVVAFSLLPFLIVTDFLLRQFWNQGLLAVINLFTSTGAFDFHKEVAAAGLNWTVGQVALGTAAVVAACLAIFWGLGKLSHSAGFRTANRHVFRVLVACWLVAVAEGGLSHVTKRTEAWQRQHKAFGLHVGLFAPPAGLERIAVSFREPLPEPEREALLAQVVDSPELRKPDIYVFMIESWRSDSITPEVAPFLSKFRDEECQQLGMTYSGSNCTPLSWFTFFHSRVAVHWADAVDAAETEEGLAGAYPVRVLDKLGYEIGVRAVCDLGYKHMGPLNFGSGNYLADQFADDSEREEPMSIPEREEIVLAAVREHLAKNPTAPQFHLLALDSPHYNYYWPDGFKVLHENCADNIPTNLRPRSEVVEGVVRRYENSVHWIDAAIEEFVNFLKVQGRYEDSIIIITGDHGEEFQEEGSWFHCSSLNRYQTEVPIIIKWPGWTGDLPAHTNVTHLDVMPSVLELIGLEPKFYEGLSGQSLLRYPETPREAILSTVHRGESGIGLCLIRDGQKAKFAFGGPWSTRAPKLVHITGYSDPADAPLDWRPLVGEGTHTDYLKAQFPTSTGRFFEKFEKD